MGKIAKVVFLGLACFLARSSPALNSTQPWLFNSLPYETTAFKETSLAYAAGVKGDSGLPWAASDHRVQFQAGLWDGLAATIDAGLDVQTPDSPRGYLERALLQASFFETGRWPLDLGATGGWSRVPGSLTVSAQGEALGFGGLVMARELFDQTFCVNALLFQNQVSVIRAAYRSSFLLTCLRLGLEGEWANQDFSWAPQASLDLPGDIVIQAGVRLDPALPGAWRGGLQVSFELFGGI